jgi:hypothetical protein
VNQNVEGDCVMLRRWSFWLPTSYLLLVGLTLCAALYLPWPGDRESNLAAWVWAMLVVVGLPTKLISTVLSVESGERWLIPPLLFLWLALLSLIGRMIDGRSNKLSGDAASTAGVSRRTAMFAQLVVGAVVLAV